MRTMLAVCVAAFALLSWDGIAEAQPKAKTEPGKKGEPTKAGSPEGERPATQEEKDKAAAAGGAMCLGFSLFTALLFVGGTFIGLLIYFTPAMIAFNRGHPNFASIFVVDFFFGWTLVGWVVALAWAVSVFDYRRGGRRYGG